MLPSYYTCLSHSLATTASPSCSRSAEKQNLKWLTLVPAFWILANSSPLPITLPSCRLRKSQHRTPTLGESRVYTVWAAFFRVGTFPQCEREEEFVFILLCVVLKCVLGGYNSNTKIIHFMHINWFLHENNSHLHASFGKLRVWGRCYKQWWGKNETKHCMKSTGLVEMGIISCIFLLLVTWILWFSHPLLATAFLCSSQTSARWCLVFESELISWESPSILQN